MTQFVAVKFKPWDHRTYTYRNDVDPVAVGDTVEVHTPKEGPKQVPVELVTNEVPAFTCKPIMRVVARAPVEGAAK